MICCGATCSAGQALQHRKVSSCGGGRPEGQQRESSVCCRRLAVPTSGRPPLALALALAGWAAECALTVAPELPALLAGLALPAQGHVKTSVFCLEHLQGSVDSAEMDPCSA